MTIKNSIPIVLLAVLPILAPAEGLETNAPPGKRYTYKESGGKPQELEVYFPVNHEPGKSKVPGVLLFHGGNWQRGDLSSFRYACHYLASRGLVAATANYRTSRKKDSEDVGKVSAGESRKRVCVTDAKSAIRWMKQHAVELGFDPQRLITGGGSAGGHISVLATTNPGLNDPTDSKDCDTSVVAYLLFNPALSITNDFKDAEVDVLKHLHAGFPPAVVFFGTADHWRQDWNEVHARLKSLGGSNIHLWLAKGEGHSFFIKPPWQELTLFEADRFLVSLGLLKGEPTLAPNAMGQALNLVP